MPADLATLRRALELVQKLKSGATVPIFQEDQACWELVEHLIDDAIWMYQESARDKAPF